MTYDRWFGYRGLDRDGIAPRYPFGFGLGYTPVTITSAEVASGERGPVVRARLSCPGPRTGTQVVQVYGTRVPVDPERPVRELLGFARVDLEARSEVDVDVPGADCAPSMSGTAPPGAGRRSPAS